MGFFIREKKDGRRTAGYGVYLAGGLVAAAAIVYLEHRTFGGSGTGRLLPAHHSNVSSITAPAAISNRIEVQPNEEKAAIKPSQRLREPQASSPPSSTPSSTAADRSFDPINAALKQAALGPPAEPAGPKLPNDGGNQGTVLTPPAFPELAPAFPPENAAQKPTANPKAPQLLGYRDESADVASLPTAVAPRQSVAVPLGIVPRGTLICTYLLTTVDTSNPSATIQFGAAKTLVFNHHFQLGFGTRFLGKLSGQPMRDRVNLVIDTILYPDGRELPISASAVEANETGSDIRPGVEGYYFPPPQWAQISPYVADFITGYMSLLQSRAEQGLTANIGGLSLQTAASTDPRPPLYQASAQAIQAFTQARLKDIEQRYATYYLVPAGTMCWLQLDRDLDLNRAQLPAQTPSQTPAAVISANSEVAKAKNGLAK